MDHIQHHLRLLGLAILDGDRLASSSLAGDLADIFAAFSGDANPPLPANSSIAAIPAGEFRQ